MNPKILSTAKALPPFTRTTEESLPWIEKWLEDQPERFRKKVLRIFRYAQVERRYGIMDVDEVFRETSFEEKNELYCKSVVRLGREALVKALEKAGLQADQIDVIITVSCTGFMIPSMDAYLINDLRMRQDIIRLPVTEMGCAAGISGLIYGFNFLRSLPGKRAAIIAVESPTSTLQHRDFSMTNMVSAAIFGDGAACTIIGPTEKTAPRIVDAAMYHFYDELDMMGFRLRNSGLQMVLDPSVPEKIERHFPEILFPFLEKNGISPEDLDHLIFHPGGKKIVQLVEELLGKLGKNIDDTKEVLRQYGNMSSATVLYVLERFLDRNIKAGDWGLMLSFGPGFSAQRVLLHWE